MEPKDTSEEAQLGTLVGARMPADCGLSGLGLLMQLSGVLTLALGIVIALAALATGPNLDLVLIGALSVVRSGFHSAAGTALYGVPGSLRGTKVYCLVAVIQSAIVAALLAQHISALDAALVFLALIAWPAALSLVLSSKRFQDIAIAVPTSEDYGLESAAVMMSVFGLTGIATMSFLLFGDVLSGGLSIVLLVLLFARSSLQIALSWRSSAFANLDSARVRGRMYTVFAVVTSVPCAGIVFLLRQEVEPDSTFQAPEGTFQSGAFFLAIASAAMVSFLLLSWPTNLSKFLKDRIAYANNEERAVSRRAPDMGLTTLGWLLLGTGTLWFSATLVVGGVLSISAVTPIWPQLEGAAVGHFSLGLVVSAVMLAAGGTLIAMSDYHRVATSVCGGVAAIGSYLLWWPGSEQISLFPLLGADIVLVQMLPFLTTFPLAITAIILVARRVQPDAKARIAAQLR